MEAVSNEKGGMLLIDLPDGASRAIQAILAKRGEAIVKYERGKVVVLENTRKLAYKQTASTKAN